MIMQILQLLPGNMGYIQSLTASEPGIWFLIWRNCKSHPVPCTDGEPICLELQYVDYEAKIVDLSNVYE